MPYDGNVDIRFYSSIERKFDQWGKLSEEDLFFVRKCLESWDANFAEAFKSVLPARFHYLFGSFHSALQPAARQAFNIPSSGNFKPWIKYLFRSTNLPAEPKHPLPNYELDTIYPKHFDLVLASSPILRTKEYLLTRIPVSTALYRDKSRLSDPLAFCVTAPDKSISILWVDPSFRGLGIGKFVAYHRLVGEGGMLDSRIHVGTSTFKFYGDKNSDILWSHADIAEDNISSKKMCESLGGVAHWSSVWIRVQISRN